MGILEKSTPVPKGAPASESGMAKLRENNSGFAMVLESLTVSGSTEGGDLSLTFSGIAATASRLSTPGKPIKVTLGERHAKSVCHGMARSLIKVYAKPDKFADRWAGTEVVFRDAFQLNEQIVARGACIGTYCDTLEDENSKRVLLQGVARMPTISFLDDEGAWVRLEVPHQGTLAAQLGETGSKTLRVQVTPAGKSKSETHEVKASDIVDALRDAVSRQKSVVDAATARKGSSVSSVLKVSLPVIVEAISEPVTDAAHVHAFGDTHRSEVVLVNTATGAAYPYLRRNEKDAKRAAADFLRQANGAEVRMYPFYALPASKGLALDVGAATANLIEDFGKEMSGPARWSRFESVMSEFNRGAGLCYDAIVVCHEHILDPANAILTVERVVVAEPFVRTAFLPKLPSADQQLPEPTEAPVSDATPALGEATKGPTAISSIPELTAPEPANPGPPPSAAPPRRVRPGRNAGTLEM